MALIEAEYEPISEFKVGAKLRTKAAELKVKNIPGLENVIEMLPQASTVVKAVIYCVAVAARTELIMLEIPGKFHVGASHGSINVKVF